MNLFLFFSVCFFLGNSLFGIEVGIVQNNLFLLHIGGDNPLFTFDVFALYKFTMKVIKLMYKHFVDLCALSPGIEILKGLENAPVVP